MNDYVRVFDTTLRDGEQSPQAMLDPEAKLEIAHQLARLGVDIIEAGFPAASVGDFEAVRRIAGEVGTEDGPVIAGLARATFEDIDTCCRAVEAAAKSRIHTFIATSEVHLRHRLHMTRAQVIQRAREVVAHARGCCEDVEFSAEDGSRSDPAFLHDVVAAVIEAGATTISIPDTVGYAEPAEYAERIRQVVESVPGIDRCVVAVHCHDDLGLATANTLAGLRAGARQAECTINGIGERAGNASLEEVVMALKTRQGVYKVRTGVDTTQLMRTSHMVALRTGIIVLPNKAVVGANAFRRERVSPDDCVFEHSTGCEIMVPETVGVSQGRGTVEKGADRAVLRARLEGLGYIDLGEDALDRVCERFRLVSEKKQQVTQAELEALVADELHQPKDEFILHGVHVSCGAPSVPTASVSMTLPDGCCTTKAAVGTGPVHAIFAAVNRIVGGDVELLEYAVHAVSGGADALGEVTVRIRESERPDRTFSGHGADVDVLAASAKAYVAAINKLARAPGWGAGTSEEPCEEASAQP